MGQFRAVRPVTSLLDAFSRQFRSFFVRMGQARALRAKMTTEIDSDTLMFDPLYEKEWIETFLTIPNEFGQTVHFNLTDQQRQMTAYQTGRDITVKGRQTRASSKIMARNTRRMTTNFGINCVVVTQTDKMTQMFRARILHHITDLANANMPFDIDKDNEDELIIGHKMKNRFIWASAQQQAGLRGVQTAHIVHASEVAHWPPAIADNIIGGLLPACPPPPYGQFDIESTPKGAEGLFWRYTMDARPFVPMSEWTVHLYPWWLERTYTIEAFRESGLYDIDEMLKTFQPSDVERKLIDEFKLTPGQILWRRIKRQSLLKAGTPFEQEYPEDITRCFITSGECYFSDPEFDHLDYYRDLQHAPMLLLRSLPYQGDNVDFHGGILNIWEPPQPGHTYAAWADTATGQSEDFSAIGVLDPTTNHLVASMRIRATPERTGEMASAVAMYYNGAFLGIERNSYGLAALSVALDRMKYPNLYYDFLNEPTHPKAGWYTTKENRDKMLGGLRAAVFGHTLVFADPVLLMEMGAFTWTKAGTTWKAEASEGQHDDMVMMMAGLLAIAPYVPKRKAESVTSPGADLPKQHRNFMR